MQLKIDIHIGKAGLLKLMPAWRKLTAQIENRRYCHCPEWYLSYLEALLPASVDILFVAVLAGDDLIAVLPLRRQALPLFGEVIQTLELISDREGSPAPRDMVLLRERFSPGLLRMVTRALGHMPGFA